VIDNVSILLSHALLAIALWRLMHSTDLDAEQPPAPDEVLTGFAPKKRASNAATKGGGDA